MFSARYNYWQLVKALDRIREISVLVKHLDSLGMPAGQITQNIDQKITQDNSQNHNASSPASRAIIP